MLQYRQNTSDVDVRFKQRRFFSKKRWSHAQPAPVTDKKLAEWIEVGEFPDIRKDFSEDEFRTLFKFRATDRNTVSGWQNLLISITGVCLGVRITALYEFTLDQFRMTLLSDNNAIIFRMKVRSRSDASKQMPVVVDK